MKLDEFEEFEELPAKYGRIVSMIRFGDTTLVATERRVFRLVDEKMEVIRFRIVDEDGDGEPNIP